MYELIRFYRQNELFIWRVLFVVALVVVLYFALRPTPLAMTGPHTDKYEHVWAFAFLAFSLGLASSRMTATTIVLALLALGGGIECAQEWFLPQRQFSLMDMVADAVGVLLGLILLALYRRFWWWLQPQQ